jgi:hypothetical protein
MLAAVDAVPWLLQERVVIIKNIVGKTGNAGAATLHINL